MTGEAEIRVGNGCGLSGTVIASFDRIVVGDDVIFGANTLITDSDWHPEDPRSGPAAPVTIGNRVWLGVGAVVLKGASVGENTVIGARSVVTSHIPSNVVAAGSPCRVIRQLNPQDLPGSVSGVG